MQKLKNMYRFKLSVCGGTFDHFHKGHKEFLRFALSQSQKIIIGITSEKYIKKNKSNNGIETCDVRVKNLIDFFSKEKLSKRVEIIKIDDVFGPTLSKNLSIQAIFTSSETIKGAKIINKYRKIKNLPVLEIIICPFSLAKDGKPISSERIRNGQINREGQLYIDNLFINNKLILSEKLRMELKNPFGILIEDFNNYLKNERLDLQKIIAVGDYIVNSFLSKSLKPKISVVDFLVERKVKFLNLKEIGFSGKEKVVGASSPPGCLTPNIFRSIDEIFKSLDKNRYLILKVNGEEDLSVLPFLLYSPLGFSVLYGQPGKGIVKIDVDEEIKEKAYNILRGFKIASK
ncbi:MAG: pantetheine-phosphate adenylyltransferase [Patescibacteria group bacterium]|nr:pantetheine-phosphate adenylyltransferase [Patescibacteria group bacterium]